MKRPYEQEGWLDASIANKAWHDADAIAQDLEQITEQEEPCEVRLRKVVARLGDTDLLDWIAPEDGNLRATALLVVRERLAWSSPLADLAFAMQGLGSFPITSRGSSALKAEFLPKVRTGRWVAAIALTEPEAGSDLANIQTTYRKESGSYILEGHKVLISNAPEADFYCVLARSADKNAERPYSMFAVCASSEGLSATATPVLGDHPIGRLDFSEVRVPSENLIAGEGDGMGVALGTLHRFRPSVGAAALGFAARALFETTVHVKTRAQFGAPLANLQAVQLRLADMSTELEAARLLVYRAAAVFDGVLAAPEGSDKRAFEARAGSMAKLVATENASRIIDQAVQLHGGRGVSRASVVAQLYDEARSLRIYEGASDIQRLLIARSALSGESA